MLMEQISALEEEFTNDVNDQTSRVLVVAVE